MGYFDHEKVAVEVFKHGPKFWGHLGRSQLWCLDMDQSCWVFGYEPKLLGCLDRNQLWTVWIWIQCVGRLNFEPES